MAGHADFKDAVSAGLGRERGGTVDRSRFIVGLTKGEAARRKTGSNAAID